MVPLMGHPCNVKCSFLSSLSGGFYSIVSLSVRGGAGKGTTMNTYSVQMHLLLQSKLDASGRDSGIQDGNATSELRRS